MTSDLYFKHESHKVRALHYQRNMTALGWLTDVIAIFGQVLVEVLKNRFEHILDAV